jgi:hypothetical protein
VHAESYLCPTQNATRNMPKGLQAATNPRPTGGWTFVAGAAAAT